MLKFELNLVVLFLVLWSENVKYYLSHARSSYLGECENFHHSSCIDTPSQNGVVEWKNRDLLETTRTFMF